MILDGATGRSIHEFCHLFEILEGSFRSLGSTFFFCFASMRKTCWRRSSCAHMDAFYGCRWYVNRKQFLGCPYRVFLNVLCWAYFLLLVTTCNRKIILTITRGISQWFLQRSHSDCSGHSFIICGSFVSYVFIHFLTDSCIAFKWFHIVHQCLR